MFKAEEEKQFENKFISPGLNTTGVRITEITSEIPAEGSPRINMTFEDGNGLTTNVDLPFSEKSTKYAMQKIAHLWNRHYAETELQPLLDQAGDSYENLATLLGQKLIGRIYTNFKFVGKEIEGKEGKNNWFKAQLGLPDFCSTDFSARKLTWDENSKYDMQRLTNTTAKPAAASANGQGAKTAKVW